MNWHSGNSRKDMKKHYIARKYRKKVAPFNDKMNNIRIDLCADYEKILEKYMEPLIRQRKSKDDAVMDFFRMQTRLIDMRPRIIHKAKALRCPAGYEEKLQYLEEHIVKGKNLLPFMTKSITNLNREDMLLYDWGIYHLHISDKKEDKSIFMERSDYLLLVYVQGADIYFLDIVSHDLPTSKLWADKRYLDIIRENWPNLLERFILKEYRSVETFDDKETYRLRKNGALLLSQWGEDGVIFSPGGGYASDNSPIRAVQSRDFWLDRISDLERAWVEVFGREVLDAIQKTPSCEDIEYVDIEMVSCSGTEFWFVEKQMHLMFVVNYENDLWTIQCVNKRVQKMRDAL